MPVLIGIKIFRPAAAAATGLLLFASFPPLGQADAAWFALAPLLLALRDITPRRGFRLGWLAGMVFWMGSLSWLWRLVDNGGPLILVLLGHGALAAYCALYSGLFGMAVAWLWRNARIESRPFVRILATLLLHPLLWTGTEYLRGVLFTGFSWNNLAVSQYRNLALIQCASFGGTTAVSFLIVAVNGGIASLVERIARDLRSIRRPAAPPPPRKQFLPRSSELMLAMLLALAAWVWGMDRIRAHRRSFEAMPRSRIAVIHPDAPSFFERRGNESAEFIEQMLAFTELASAGRPHLVVWPETALPGALPHDEDTRGLVAEAVRIARAPLLAGGMFIETIADDNGGRKARFYNGAFLFNPRGAIESVYHKQHLVPFGEYIPGDVLFPRLAHLSPIGFSCSPGRQSTLMPLKTADAGRGLWLSPLICFEDAMPYLARRAVAKGASLLVNLTNDAWFDGSHQSEQHLAQAVLRCVENGVPMVRCANRGVSAVILPTGRIARRLGDGTGSGTPGFLVDEVPLPAAHPNTPFNRWGELPWGLPGVLMLAFFLGAVIVERSGHRANASTS